MHNTHIIMSHLMAHILGPALIGAYLKGCKKAKNGTKDTKKV